MDSVQRKAQTEKKRHSGSGRKFVKVPVGETSYFEKVIFHCNAGYNMSINFCQLGYVSKLLISPSSRHDVDIRRLLV